MERCPFVAEEMVHGILDRVGVGAPAGHCTTLYTSIRGQVTLFVPRDPVSSKAAALPGEYLEPHLKSASDFVDNGPKVCLVQVGF